jgi:hypothetical protein
MLVYTYSPETEKIFDKDLPRNTTQHNTTIPSIAIASTLFPAFKFIALWALFKS